MQEDTSFYVENIIGENHKLFSSSYSINYIDL